VATANWALTVVAFCVSALRGLQYVQSTALPGSTFGRSATATCPAGSRVVGAGGQINGGRGAVILDGVRPSAALTSVTVDGYEDESEFVGVWSVTATAVCAAAPPGLRRVVADSSADSVGSKTATAVCPPGTQVHGLAGELSGATGQVLLDVFAGSATEVSVTGHEDADGFAGDWFVTAYAICAE
jgi:hypothetical protein